MDKKNIKDMPLGTLDGPDDSTPKYIPLPRLIELRSKGLSYKEIGNIVGCSKQALHERLIPFKDEIESLKEFKDNRADLFATYQHILLNSLTVEDIKRMAPASRITSAAILYDKERLESGKSTANVSYHGLINEANTLMEEIQQLRQELGIDDTVAIEAKDLQSGTGPGPGQGE